MTVSTRELSTNASRQDVGKDDAAKAAKAASSSRRDVSASSSNPEPSGGKPSGAARRILGWFLPFAIVAAGILGAVALKFTGPEARQRPAQRIASLVEIRPLAMTSEIVTVEDMGTVMAAREIVIQPQVNGIVTKLHPSLVPGGRVSAGETLLEIDRAQFEASVAQAEASLARNRAELQSAVWEMERLEGLESSNSANKKELDNGKTAKAVAEANVRAAEAALALAKIDLERTTIRAPFSGTITQEAVDVGSHITSQSQVATLVGSDTYWVRMTVPVDRLNWIKIPSRPGERGSSVLVQQQLGDGFTAEWRGKVIRLMGDLEPQGRMARLLISVEDPLGLKSDSPNAIPLLIGAFVDVAISGRQMDNVVAIARKELRDNDTVWLMNDKNELEIRQVHVIVRERDRVLVDSGLAAGERLVLTDLATAVPGMPLRLLSDERHNSSQPAAERDGEHGSEQGAAR